MKLATRLLLAAAPLVVALAALPAAAQDQDQAEAIARIRDEGMNRSSIPLMAHELLDGIGPRLTNSPNMRRAEDWAVREFEEMGLARVRKEGFEFGRGWEIVASDVHMISPRPIELTAIPIAWTPGTNGPLDAEIVVAPMENEADFAAYRGQLAGKIVLVSLPGTGDEPTEPAFVRLDAAQIGALESLRLPNYDRADIERRVERAGFALARDAFLASEGAVAWAQISRADGKLLHGEGYTHRTGSTPALPGLEIAAEDYRRLARLARSASEGTLSTATSAPVLRIDSNVRFVDEDTRAYNIIAEIPGSDPDAGYVMAGAHFDSWVGGDGAVDNGAGSVTVMEAARIIRTLGIRPRRSIRFVLWNAEEQGLFGSLAYVREHLASRAGDDGSNALTQYYSWPDLWPITPKPGYNQLKAYFNMDNGSGKIRGIYGEGNVAAGGLLSKWLAPFADLDAASVVSSQTTGTDHVFLQSIGLPGFQFIQDPLDYESRLHHTNIDTYDHLRPDDLRQAAVVMAGVLWQAANDAETLPTEPLPTRPVATDPFAYDYPED